MRSPSPIDPRESWASERATFDPFGIFAFCAVMILFTAVAAGLYSGSLFGGQGVRLDDLVNGRPPQPPLQLTAGALPPSRPETQTSLRSIAAEVAARAAVVATPTAAAQPAPRGSVQSSGAALYVPPIAQPRPVAPTAIPQPTATAVPAPPTAQLKVMNTGGDGAYIRRTPRMDDKIVAWLDGTPMQYMNEQVDVDGTHWVKVRDPKGNIGWLPGAYLGPA